MTYPTDRSNSVRVPRCLDRDEDQPGYLNIRIVKQTRFSDIFFCIDVCTGWTNIITLPRNNQDETCVVLYDIYPSLPFDQLEMCVEGSGLYMEERLVPYCLQRNVPLVFAPPITFMLPRKMKRIGSPDWYTILDTINYGHVESTVQLALLKSFHRDLCLYMNFFHPFSALIGSRSPANKIPDNYAAKSPYQRVMERADISPSRKQALRNIYLALQPEEILKRVGVEIQLPSK